MQQNRLGPLLARRQDGCWKDQDFAARRRQDGCWKDQDPNPSAGPALPGSQQINRHVPHQHFGMELLPASGGIYGYSTSIIDFSA